MASTAARRCRSLPQQSVCAMRGAAGKRSPSCVAHHLRALLLLALCLSGAHTHTTATRSTGRPAGRLSHGAVANSLADSDASPLPAYCHNWTLPQRRWRVYGQPIYNDPTALLHPYARLLEQPRVAFVPTNERPSSDHRCIDAPELTAAKVAHCESSKWDSWFASQASSFDVFVHCKFYCSKVGERETKVHIVDRIDSYDRIDTGPPYNNHQISAEIFNSETHMDNACSTRLCVVIPHHFNLDCVPRRRPAAHETAAGGTGPNGTIVVGLVGSVDDAIVHMLHNASDVHLLREPYNMKASGASRKSGSCAFFGQLDVAVAWHAWYANTKDILEGKPAERVTNPIMLNVPTVSYGGYASFRAVNHPALTCMDPACVLRRVRGLARRRRELLQAVAEQQACVHHQLSPTTMRRYYSELFEMAWRTKQVEQWRAGAYPTLQTAHGCSGCIGDHADCTSACKAEFSWAAGGTCAVPGSTDVSNCCACHH